MVKIFGIFIFLILLTPAILSFGIKSIPDNFQPSLDYTLKIYGENKISQLITADKNQFYGFGVSIRNFNLMNKKDITMDVYQGGTILREVTVNGGVIEDGKFVKFMFDPIENSENQTYKIEFSAKDSERDEALQIFMSKNNQGSLSSVLFYRPSNKIALVESIYKDWFRKLTSDKLFFIFYSLSLVLCLGYLLKINHKS